MRRRERKGRRKWELPESSCLGHTVKNCMTVISKMERYHFTGRKVRFAEKAWHDDRSGAWYFRHKTPTIYLN